MLPLNIKSVIFILIFFTSLLSAQPNKIFEIDSNTSHISYTYTDAVSLGTFCAEAGNGLHSVVGWYLNNERVSYYGNSNNSPVWEFALFNTPLHPHFIGISSNGGVTASGFYHNAYLLDGSNGNPVFNLNTRTLPVSDSGFAGPIALNSTGNFFIVSVYRLDSNTVYGFNSNSTIPVWRLRFGHDASGESTIQGIKISGNDSLILLNQNFSFYVIKTFTGQVIYQGSVNPSGSNGTQTTQGISGNGNIIAVTNYDGFVTVYQWNGVTYNQLWQNHDNTGIYNISAVDVSYDGSMIACGTLDYPGGGNHDGRIKFFSTAAGSTPLWTYNGCGDKVTALSFSKNGRILSASSWGSLSSHTAKNLLVFKTTHLNNIPIYSVNDYGSFYWCSTSDNGLTVIGSGKAIHARQIGEGGIFYNLAIDTSESPLGIENNHNSIPSSFRLQQNYPNPFNPSAKIKFEVPKASFIKLIVYDAAGREISELVNEQMQPGIYETEFNGTNLPSGVYFYKLTSGSFTDTKKMLLLK